MDTELKGVWTENIKCTGEGNNNRLFGKIPCGKILKISCDDVFVTHALHYDGEQDLYYSVKCDCCECITDISERIVPKDVKSAALKKYIEKRNTRFIDTFEK